jgi:hypothetical protein
LSRASRAVLLAALVFPGAGHFFLKRKAMAWILVLTSSACLYQLIVSAVVTANSISDKIMHGKIPLDVEQISAAVSTELATKGGIMLSVASWILLGCWLIGILDAYRIAKLSE